MTVKELKEKINSIPDSLDNAPIVIEKTDDSDYCFGNKVKDIDVCKCYLHTNGNWIELLLY